MKTFLVTIEAVVTKIHTIKAEDEISAREEAYEVFNLLPESSISDTAQHYKFNSKVNRKYGSTGKEALEKQLEERE